MAEEFSRCGSGRFDNWKPARAEQARGRIRHRIALSHFIMPTMTQKNEQTAQVAMNFYSLFNADRGQTYRGWK
ncbi:MAG: hypothetical protein AAB380_02440 [Verrucomicrobiota bacterium]